MTVRENTKLSTRNEKTVTKQDLDDIEKKLNTSLNGLTQEEAQHRLDQYSPDEITEEELNPILKVFSYFWGPIPWMIEIAAVLSVLVQHWVDLIIILALLVFYAVVGFWQEFQAANAVDVLKKQLALKARVKRDGKGIELMGITTRHFLIVSRNHFILLGGSRY